MAKKTFMRCRFCNGEISGRERTNEHIVPDWLLKHLGISDLELFPTHLGMNADGSEPEFISLEEFDADNLKVKSQRKHAAKNLLLGGICANCNNGWMSRLEAECKDSLLSLIDKECSLDKLMPKDKFKIARWATKTAYCLNAGSNYFKIVPDEHFRLLFSQPKLLPKGCAVFAYQSEIWDEPIFWTQSRSWTEVHSPRPAEELGDIIRRTYKVLLSFRHLILLVAYCPTEDNWRFQIDPDAHFMLWSWQRACGISRREKEFPKETIPLCGRVNHSLGLNDVAEEHLSAVNLSKRYRGRKIGANEPCWCGGGLKFKKCHGSIYGTSGSQA